MWQARRMEESRGVRSRAATEGSAWLVRGFEPGKQQAASSKQHAASSKQHAAGNKQPIRGFEPRLCEYEELLPVLNTQMEQHEGEEQFTSKGGDHGDEGGRRVRERGGVRERAKRRVCVRAQRAKRARVEGGWSREGMYVEP